jgi:Ca-activated chloride channel family protein
MWTGFSGGPLRKLAIWLLVLGAVAATYNRAGHAQQRNVPAAWRARSAETDSRIVVNTDLVTLKVAVTDRRGKPIKGLDKTAFTVYDNKVPQQISYFSGDDSPASISIVFDTSGSMSGAKIARARQALERFIETSRSDDEFFLIDFNSRATLLLDRNRDSDAVLDKFTYVEPHGQTALYDAVYLGIEKAERGTRPRKAVLLITDGEDNNSRFTLGEVRQRLKESDVTVYAIGILGPQYPAALRGNLSGRSVLEQLTSASGGRAYFPDNSTEMSEAFENIALDLRHQYVIGYRPTNFAADGKWRRVKVTLTPPEGSPPLVVRTRGGYYAAPSAAQPAQ